MIPLLEMTVYWCLAIFPIDDFNPHGVGAVARYVAQHPGICRSEVPTIFDGIDISVNECQTQAVLHVIPQFEAEHPGVVVLGAPCKEHVAPPFEIHAEGQK